MNKEVKATGIVLLAGLAWGFQNVWVKMLSAYAFESMQITFVKLFIAALVLAVVQLIRNPKSLKIDIKDIWMFLGTGILSATCYSFFGFYTTIHGGVALSEVLTYTSPIFVLIFSAIIFKERITGKKVIAIVLTFLGCVLTAGLIGGGYRFETIVVLTGLAAGFFWGLYTIFSRFALRKYETMTVITWTFIVGAVSCIPFAGFPSLVSTTAQNPIIILWMLCLGVLSAALPYFLYTTGLSMMEPSKASIISSFELVVGSVAGMTLFNEPHDIGKIVGILVILAAIIILNVNFKKK